MATEIHRSHIDHPMAWRGSDFAGKDALAVDLSARQIGLLLHIYLAPPPHTVRGLALDLNMSKPAVTRALDRLSALGYLKRETDARDRRSVLVKRTVAGAVFLRDFADMIMGQARRI